MKKILLLLILTIATISFAGCANNQKKSSNDEQNYTEDDNSENKDKTPTSINTKVALEINGDILTVTFSGYAVELFWQILAEEEASGINEEVIFYPSIFSDVYFKGEESPTSDFITLDSSYNIENKEFTAMDNDYIMVSAKMDENIVYTVDLTKVVTGYKKENGYFSVASLNEIMLSIASGGIKHSEIITNKDISITGEQTPR